MMKNKPITYLLLAFNILIISLLIHFLYKGFYHSGYTLALSGNGFYYFGIRPYLQYWVIIGIIIPILIAIFSKKYSWILQSLLIIVVSLFWKEDFFQKTIFINQPTSRARSHKIIKHFADKNERKIENDIKQLTEECYEIIKDKSFDGITTISLSFDSTYSQRDTIRLSRHSTQTSGRYIGTYLANQKLVKSEIYEIRTITLENKEIVRLDIVLIKPEDKKYYGRYIHYYPLGIKNTGIEWGLDYPEELYELNTNIYLEEVRRFVYKNKWTILLQGPFTRG